jgi:hypothetical protein
MEKEELRKQNEGFLGEVEALEAQVKLHHLPSHDSD